MEYYEKYHTLSLLLEGTESLKTVARISVKYRLNLVSVQEVRGRDNSVMRKVVHNILTDFGHSIMHMDTSNMNFCVITKFC
jgi:hypothetical protein